MARENRYDGLERGVLLYDEKQTIKVQPPRPQGMKYPLPSPAGRINPFVMFQCQLPCKCHVNQKHSRRKWATNGPAMQAVFLGSGPQIGGTGVFIPRTEGAAQISKKPAYSPVLLPTRVVQTLNINVHELGEHVKPKPDQVKNVVKKNDMEDDVIYISPEIILPKEWTY